MSQNIINVFPFIRQTKPDNDNEDSRMIDYGDSVDAEEEEDMEAIMAEFDRDNPFPAENENEQSLQPPQPTRYITSFRTRTRRNIYLSQLKLTTKSLNKIQFDFIEHVTEFTGSCLLRSLCR